MPTSTSSYIVLIASGVSNVNIIGGTLLGNRSNNTITDTTEDGNGIQISVSSNVVVQGVTANNFWCDGFYLTNNPSNVTMCGCVAGNNRRNGLSVTSVNGMVIRNCTFQTSTGFLENGSWVSGNGVDLEPNQGETVKNVQFVADTFTHNYSDGISIGPPIAYTGSAFTTNIIVDSSTFTSNGLPNGAAGIDVSNTTGQQISNNVITGSMGDGIYLREGANSNLVTGNTVIGTLASPAGDPGNGIMLYEVGGNLITGNTVQNSAACGLRNADPTATNTFTSNTLSGNHPDSAI